MQRRFCDMCKKEIPVNNYYYISIHFANPNTRGQLKRIDLCENCMLEKKLIDNKFINYINRMKIEED